MSPTRPLPRRSTVVALAAALALAGSAALAPGTAAANPSVSSPLAAPTVRFVDIPGAGGVVLKGNVVTPADGLARHPLVVLPASWGLNDLEYLAQAEKLAAAGYVVVSYTPRGFWGSGGQIDVAGPDDVADVSKVIDWALAHTPSDPERVGMAGVSYGAGLGLMGAAFDKRIKAVAAMSAWADLVASLYGSETQHLQSTALLAVAGYLTGRPDAELQSALKTFFTSDYPMEAELKAWAKVRSPQTYLGRINANHAAIMLANAWGDSLFPPNQLTRFFEGLTGPKRLEFRPGDHATAELTGLLGLPNDTWSDATAWLDHYLKGTDNGINHKPAVHLEPQLQDGYEDYRSWQSVSGSALRLELGKESWTGSGSLSGQAQTGWHTTIGTYADSGADGGVIFLSSLAEQFLKTPPTVSVPLLPHAVSAVWESAAYETAQRVRGTAHLHLGVTPSASHGSLIAYLYDVDALGVGKLITHAPYTFLDRTPGHSFDVDLDLQATAYDVPAGHHLAMVVDAVDPLYLTHNPAGAKLAFDSPAGDPAIVTVPTG